MAEYIDRPRVKAEAKVLLRDAQVSPRSFFLIYLLIVLGLNTLSDLANGDYTTYAELLARPLGLFALVLISLVALLLNAGVYLYCLSVRRGERAEYMTLFDGFSFAGKIILLYLAECFFVLLWLMLFIIPGLIAIYRYRFALFNLYENPSLGVMEALEMSKRQTLGYKGQLLLLDLSYFCWYLLANLPSLVYGTYLSWTVLDYAQLATFSLSLPLTFLFGLWAVAVEIFFLPTYYTTELGFWEVAKRSSGVSSAPSDAAGSPSDGNV